MGLIYGHYGLLESKIFDLGQNKILKVTSFQICACWKKYGNNVQALTTNKQAVNVKCLIMH